MNSYFLQGVDGTWILVFRGNEEKIEKVLEILGEAPNYISVPPELFSEINKLGVEWVDRDRRGYIEPKTKQENRRKNKVRKRDKTRKT